MRKITPVTQDPAAETPSAAPAKLFRELGLSEPLQRALDALAYETLTPVQAAAIPVLLGEPTDFLGLAATGTGKTAAFAIPVLERFDPKQRQVQTLILCPTRELVVQTAGQINLMARYMDSKALPIYGGTAYGDQFRGLRDGARIVVGTPGRVVDHMEKGTLDLTGLTTLVLDEADEMISMGFKEDLETVLRASPHCPVWLFSATMSPEVRRVADAYLKDPHFVQVNRTEMVPEAIDQIYYRCHEGDKPEIICKLIDAADDFYGLIFCQTKSLVTDLTEYLKKRGYSAESLQGDMDQQARDRAMKTFRDRRATVLVCTDVASRGLDVKDITHVINYSIPRELDSYVHRIGRTARSGKTGFAMSLVTPSHRPLVQKVERMTRTQMREGKLPTRKEIGAKKVAKVLERFAAQTGQERAAELMGDEWKKALSGMSPEEIAGRFLALAYPEIFTVPAAEELPAVTPPHPERAPSRPTGRVINRPPRGYSPWARPPRKWGEQRSW